MPYVLRRTTTPTVQEITSVPQIVIVDQAGPDLFTGVGDGISCLVGEFIKGPFTVAEPGSGAAVGDMFGNSVFKYFSQNGVSGTPIQDGTQGAFNGNGMLQLQSLRFKRLAISRVDNEAVTADVGTTKGQLSITVTVAASDQDGANNTKNDILIPAGKLFGSANTVAGSTRLFCTSGDTIIPKGTALTSNAVTVLVNCIPIRVVEPVVATAIAAIIFVLEPALDNVSATTTITAVNNATALWPPGTGTTLATRMEGRYQAAIDRTMPGTDSVTPDIVHVWSARRSQVIRQALTLNAANASEIGRARTTTVAADPATTPDATGAAAAKTAALGLAASDAYAQPADRTFIAFPHNKVFVPGLGISVMRSSDCLLAAVLANVPNEDNPGEQNSVLQSGAITSVEDAFVASPLAKQDVINLLAAGVCPLRKDRTAGWWFEDGRTAAPRAQYPSRYTIKRRRMADEIQDSIAAIAANYMKKAATNERVESFLSEVNEYLAGLKAEAIPSQQRIVDYSLDDKTANTAALLAQGIFTLIVKVRILSTMDDIVINSQIGESVVTTSAA